MHVSELRLQNFKCFRDRDSDAEPPTEPALIHDEATSGTTPVWLSYRAAIENYLIDANLVHQYWSDSQAAPAWKHGGPPDISELREWIINAARNIAPYQAARWGLAKLKPGKRWPDVPDRLTKASGKLPQDLSRKACRDNAHQLIEGYVTAASKVTVSAFDETFERFELQFSSDSFFATSDFLVWFHGKDLLKSMQRRWPGRISLAHYCKWAVEHVDCSQFTDLSSLAGQFQ